MAADFKACSIDGCNKPRYGRGLCAAHYAKWRKYGDPLHYVRTPNGDPQKFIDLAVSYVGNKCLPWPFSCDGNGYGQIGRDGRAHYVHRLVCEQIHGAAPTPEHQAAHSCGKGHLGCVNPRHLSWKTRPENEADKLTHGTRARGAHHHRAKLTEGDVREIRALKGKVHHLEIAKRFNVSRQLVYRIHQRQCWAWLPD